MAAERPNVLFICTDQQRFDTIGALGNPVIKTPHLNRLCAEGTAFTSAYSPAPECVPARCSFTYGQYPHNTGCFSNGSPFPPHEARASWVAALADAGYRTHAIGKCHFQGDQLRGFQTRERGEEGFPAQDADDYMTFLVANGYDHIGDPHGVRGEMYYIPQPAQMPAHLHGTHWVGNRATSFIEENAAGEQPWMLYLGIIHPHPPFSPPTPWHKLYRAPLMSLPNVPADHESLWTWVNKHQNRYKYRDQGIDNNLLRNIRAYYYACISFIDFQIGRILESLEQTGQLDDTLIVYSSDHGELLGDYHCFGKRSMHDACSRVPMLLRYPQRFAAGGRCDTPVSLIDIAPTALAATGVAAPDSHRLDGVDMAAIASGESDRDAVIIEYNSNGRGIYTCVTPRWKYTWSEADQREFLFDRVEDPRETRDQAGFQLRAPQVKMMREGLMALMTADGPHPAITDGKWTVHPPFALPENPDAGLLIQDMGWVDLSIPGYTD